LQAYRQHSKASPNPTSVTTSNGVRRMRFGPAIPQCKAS
jgi:hypothetical protein